MIKTMTAICFFLTLSLPYLTTTVYGQLVCGTPGNICPENFTIQVNSSQQCGIKYSEIFSEPNITQDDDIPAANFTFTNETEFKDITMYLSEVLQGKANELYSEQKALVDGAPSCQSSSLKTEFTSTRLNASQCTIDIDDVVESITPILQEKWLVIHYGKSSDHPAKSCKDLYETNPQLPSDYYWIQGSGGATVQVYCNMEGTNCDDLGGWMRVYKLDLEGTDTTFHSCPSSDFVTYTGAGKLMCIRKSLGGGCRSASFNTNGQSYSKVCGKAIGYQKGTTDSFSRSGGAYTYDVDDNYVDGISITHGSGPRTHIFTYAAGCSESGSCHIYSRCPCQTGTSIVQIPKFIGVHDYYCEAGSYWHPQSGTWYTDPLWDGKDCPNKESPCCAFTNKFPWFYKALPLATENSIEMRMCTNGGDSDENFGISQFELYVK